MKEIFPNKSVEYFISYDYYYQPLILSFDKDASLIERQDTIVVATVSAIYGLGELESYFKMALHLVRGSIIK